MLVEHLRKYYYFLHTEFIIHMMLASASAIGVLRTYTTK